MSSKIVEFAYKGSIGGSATAVLRDCIGAFPGFTDLGESFEDSKSPSSGGAGESVVLSGLDGLETSVAVSP